LDTRIRRVDDWYAGAKQKDLASRQLVSTIRDYVGTPSEDWLTHRVIDYDASGCEV
jgi:hypothetical protein